MTDFKKISPPKARNIFLISLFVPLVRWVLMPPGEIDIFVCAFGSLGLGLVLKASLNVV